MVGTWLFAGQAVQAARNAVTPGQAGDGAHVVLADGRVLTTDLLVAADSRHSSTRRALGIAADMHDFGRTMLVCVMTHPVPHHHAACASRR
jgi:2-polyprenyl-6-methoxyphenol hydroxylase-like FAD-dependent oxidoreductase